MGRIGKIWEVCRYHDEVIVWMSGDMMTDVSLYNFRKAILDYIFHEQAAPFYFSSYTLCDST
jgi:hypothetical protein